MKNYARIYDGSVIELFSTDRIISEMFHPDMIWVDISDMSPAPVVGWTAEFIDDVWSIKAPVKADPTVEELKLAATNQRDTLMSLANAATDGLGDAYMIGILDTDDTAFFKEYAAYKLALVNIEKQPGYPKKIIWPMAPTKP
jgi:hypothetical protein